jgi:hypothetical protein
MKMKFYYLIRHVQAQRSSIQSTRQIVAHGLTKDRVENHLNVIHEHVHMPIGCFYTIEHF